MKTKYFPNHLESYNFEYVHILPEDQVGYHQQVTWELSYIMFGKGIRKIGNTKEEFNQGEIILIPPNIQHCWEFDHSVVDGKGKIENITIVFPVSFFDRCKINFPELVDTIGYVQDIETAISFEGKTKEKLQRLMSDMIKQNRVERLSSIFRIFDAIGKKSIYKIAGKIKEDDKSEQRLKKVHLFVLNNYHKHISLDQIAHIVEMQKSSFCTFYKKETGKSFFDYLTNFRINSSCEMLEKTKLSIAEIAIFSGFNDIPYYNRTFKKMKNCTPKEYRTRFFI